MDSAVNTARYGRLNSTNGEDAEKAPDDAAQQHRRLIGKARRTAALTDAAPIRPQIYALIRCGAALTGTALLACLCLAEAAVFYSHYFRWHAWGSLLLPAAVTLIPSLVFALGSGWLLGRIRQWLVYVWMPLPFVLQALPLPAALGIWNC